jgi:Zn-dependent peptidase ImmA (M78 family)
MTPAKRSRSPRGTLAKPPRTAHPNGAAAGEATPEAVRFEPLPRDWDEQAAALADTFLSISDPHASEREALQRFAHFCLRFAHMEKRIQGEIIFNLSAHSAVVRGEHAPGLLEEAENLAGQERRNLDVPDGAIEDLADLLDDRGIKAVQWPSPPGVRRCGAFLFDASTGPALLSMAPSASVACRFILAHEYGHLLADVDPYENRFCPQPSLAESGTHGGGRLFEAGQLPHAAVGGLEVAEVRADLFARAFLMPATHFLSSLKLFGIRPQPELDLTRLADLAFYYGVETAVALARLADLRVLPAAEVRAIGAQHASLPEVPPLPAAEHEPGAGCASRPPARFANLGMAMFLRRLVSLEQMAALLGIDQAAAMEFLSWTESQAGEKKTAGGSREREGSRRAGSGREAEGGTDSR